MLAYISPVEERQQAREHGPLAVLNPTQEFLSLSHCSSLGE
jgi:hypothetical protein